jgi:UDP-glucose 4-epimerase
MVTGGNGFLGSHICRALAESGLSVIAYDAAPASDRCAFVQEPFGGQIRYASGQVTDLGRVLAVCRELGVAHIVHTAAFVEVGGSVDQPSSTYKVNIEGSIVMYEAARLLGLGRVVLISSNAVYQTKSYEPIDERHPVFVPDAGNPAAHYGASKLAAEIIGLTYADFNAVDFVALRPSAIYGFGMNLPLYVKPMVEAAVAGATCRFESGAEMRRDYTYVKDCARAVLQVLQAHHNPLNQRVFNVSSGKTSTAADVARTVAEIIPGARIEIGPGLSPTETSDIRARGALDWRKAHEAFGYGPTYDLKRGLEDYVETLRAYNRSTSNGGQQ